MTALGEKTLMAHLVETDSVELLAKEGLKPDTIPTKDLRPVVGWALAHYRQTGKAPTAAVLQAQFGDMLADHEVSWDDEVDETIEWAIDDLKASYARNEAGSFARRLATEVTEALPDERVEVISQFATELASIAMDLQPRTTHVDLRNAGLDILADYQQAVNSQGQVNGLAFGLPLIDAYTRGIRPGELAVCAGGPKTGKSWFLDFVAYQEWSRGRVAGLYTLENSIEMTRLRLACVALNISIQELQDGTLSDADLKTLTEWVYDVLAVSDTPLYIMSPTSVNRSPQAIVQSARAYEVDSLIVDQFTFLEPGGNKKRERRDLEVRDMMHDMKNLISEGRHPIPCLMAHQINREGVKAAEKTGRLSMYSFAEGAEIERTVDWGFGIYQSNEMRVLGRMLFQTLAARRAPQIDFDLNWAIEIGSVGVINRVEMDSDT